MPFLGGIKADQKVDERAFTGSGGTDKGYSFSMMQGEGDVFQHGFLGVITENDIAELDVFEWFIVYRL
jgi:hypothetical protein